MFVPSRRFLGSTLFTLTAIGALGLSQDAAACGGLFCDSSNPVNQAAERIIFAKNDDGTVTAAIEIMYEGPSDEFAWVLPVPPGEIEVGVSSTQALDRLDQQSNPRYRLDQEFESCGGDGDDVNTADSASDAEGAPGGNKRSDVIVLDEGSAGPYDWVQLKVDPELDEPVDVALMWLEGAGFDVTNLGTELLAEYLEDGQNLVAFKLQKGKNEGSIRPVLITYESERPLIPIKPTAVAANEDMGIKVWVLGDSRAISNNYPHLELNEALINWFSPQSNYNDVVIAAANESDDGQGFVTEQSGPAGAFAQNLYQDFEADMWNELRTGQFATLQDFLVTARDYFSGYDGFNDVLFDPEIVPLREGATPEQFVACIACYFETNVAVRNEAYPATDYLGADDPINGIDITLFLERFYEYVIEPLELTRAMFEAHSHVTRFYTTLSPDEMTLDPEFDFNPELEDVDNLHVARQIFSCEGDTWRIVLPQGMEIRGENFGGDWPVSMDDELPVNLRIVQLGTKGDGEVLADNAEQIALRLTELDVGDFQASDVDDSGDDDSDDASGGDSKREGVDDGSDDGCACRVAGAPARSPSPWWLLLGAGLMLRRRR